MALGRYRTYSLAGFVTACALIVTASFFNWSAHTDTTYAGLHHPPIWDTLHDRLTALDSFADLPALAVLPDTERFDASSPRKDSNAVAYVIDNQPGARWRFTADRGFSPIDPHIRA